MVNPIPLGKIILITVFKHCKGLWSVIERNHTEYVNNEDPAALRLHKLCVPIRVKELGRQIHDAVQWRFPVERKQCGFQSKWDII